MTKLSLKEKNILIKSVKHIVILIFFICCAFAISKVILHKTVTDNNQKSESTSTDQKAYNPYADKIPEKKFVKKIIKRDLTEEELNKILKDVEPAFQKAAIDINALTDEYSKRIKNIIKNKESNIPYFTEEVFSLKNTLKYLGYYVSFQKEKITPDLTKIWEEKMFTSEALSEEINSELKDYKENVSAKINIMKSEINIEIDGLVDEPSFENIEIKDVYDISNSIENQIETSIIDEVAIYMAKEISFMTADFLFTETIIKFIIIQSATTVGLSVSSKVLSISTFIAGIAIGVTVDKYIQNRAEEKMKEKIEDMLYNLSYDIVDGKYELKNKLKKISYEISQYYSSETLREKIIENIKIKTIVMVEE